VVRRAVEELSDAQIERLMDFGRREARLIDELEIATRAGNRERAWELAQELCRIQDEAKQPPPAA
jgi:hypothetical protein